MIRAYLGWREILNISILNFPLWLAPQVTVGILWLRGWSWGIRADVGCGLLTLIVLTSRGVTVSKGACATATPAQFVRGGNPSCRLSSRGDRGIGEGVMSAVVLLVQLIVFWALAYRLIARMLRRAAWQRNFELAFTVAYLSLQCSYLVFVGALDYLPKVGTWFRLHQGVSTTSTPRNRWRVWPDS